MNSFGLGRRKSSVARILLTTSQSPELFINQKLNFDYFQQDPGTTYYIQKFLEQFSKPYKIVINVSGGGITGQREAIGLALSKILCQLEKKSELLPIFTNLTQDSRIKERRKYGLKKARKAQQYSKR